VNHDGKVIYRAGKRDAIPYPISGDVKLKTGIPRNFQIFEPLDFLAEVTQHIPRKGEHQIRYYGQYSNKRRGQKAKQEAVEKRTLDAQQKKFVMKWAQLIKMVYEVDPLICPKCGGMMKIVSFIEEKDLIRKILTHCRLWKDPPQRPPTQPVFLSPTLEYDVTGEYIPDYLC
jgi:hypothetical protein